VRETASGAAAPARRTARGRSRGRRNAEGTDEQDDAGDAFHGGHPPDRREREGEGSEQEENSAQAKKLLDIQRAGETAHSIMLLDQGARTMRGARAVIPFDKVL